MQYLSKKEIAIVAAAAILFFVISAIYYNFFRKPQEPVVLDIKNFDECGQYYPVLESYPRQCKTPNGKTFTEDIGNELEKQDLIRISNPRPNQVITSPLEITGEARGYWFFEASFPIKIYDENGKQLGIAVAQAQGDWMTENFVAFRITLEFEAPTTKRGVLVLEKDNPSGLPENADALQVPVKFSE